MKAKKESFSTVRHETYHSPSKYRHHIAILPSNNKKNLVNDWEFDYHFVAILLNKTVTKKTFFGTSQIKDSLFKVRTILWLSRKIKIFQQTKTKQELSCVLLENLTQPPYDGESKLS